MRITDNYDLIRYAKAIAVEARKVLTALEEEGLSNVDVEELARQVDDFEYEEETT